MARDRAKQGPGDSGGGLQERRRVLKHASSLDRSDIIRKVVLRQQPSPQLLNNEGSDQPVSSPGRQAEEVDREVLDYVDEEGLTALHYAVMKSSLDVSLAGLVHVLWCEPMGWCLKSLLLYEHCCTATAVVVVALLSFSVS